MTMRFAPSFALLVLHSIAVPLLWSQASPPPAAPSAQAVDKGVGDLTILPTRVVLEGRIRASEVMLKNAGKAPATYRIFVQEMEMTPEGQLRQRTKAPKEITAADLIRFSPHQVDLAPGESQIVRIQVRKPEDLLDGEYRSHMVFQGIPPAEAPETTDPQAAKTGISITIKPIYGISIPIIIRSGTTTASVEIGKLTYLPATKEGYLSGLRLDLVRQGNRSVMGDVEASLDSGGTIRKGTVVGKAKGVAIYPSIASRQVLFPLEPPKGESLKGARVKVTFAPRDIKLPPAQGFIDIP